MSNVLIVLGMHRSGTSLTAQWLHRCGINVGEQLIGARPSNRDGHFEDVEFHDVHEAIFRAHGIPYGGFEHIEALAPTREDVEALAALVRKRNAAFAQWAWKDPRTCLFIDDYLRLIPAARLLVVVRDYNAVVNSLINRDIKRHRRRLQASGRMGRIRALVYDILEARGMRRRLAGKYSRATICYYRKILAALAEVAPENALVVTFEGIADAEQVVARNLTAWGFDIEAVGVDGFWNAGYITSAEHCREIGQSEREQLERLQNEILAYSGVASARGRSEEPLQSLPGMR